MKARIRCGCLAMAGLVGGLGAIPSHATLPIDGVHPAFQIAAVPLTAKYKTMGLAFLSDGRMVVLTTGKIGGGEVPDLDPEAAVYIITGQATGAPQAVKVAANFLQPSGVNVVNDKIYVTDRDAFYSITSNDKPSDPAANKVKVFAWPMAQRWHQWVFTPMFKDGSFYAPYSGSIRLGGPSDVPATSEYSGAFLKWDPAGKNLEKIAGGLRSPNGSAMNEAGEMFVMDNQGSYLPGCSFMHMKPGKFYGHKQTGNAPNFAEALTYQAPAVWIPYPSQVAGAATAQPVYIPKGTYAGQWLAGDANGPGLTRYALEMVKGDYQGTVFRFSNGTANAAINRLAWGPDGALYLGSLEKYGNWPGNGAMPLYRMTPKEGASAFEMLAIRSLVDGFEVVFTEPVDKATVAATAFQVKQSQYTRGAAYGCCKENPSDRAVTGTEVSTDGLRVRLQVTGLKESEYVTSFKITGVKSAAGKAPWDNEAWYTLNRISDRIWNASEASALRGRTAVAEGKVSEAAAGTGLLKVALKLEGAWSLEVRGVDGSLAARLNGSGPGTHLVPSGRGAPGVYVLSVRSNAASFSRKVFF